jgi:hypothetical protein
MTVAAILPIGASFRSVPPRDVALGASFTAQARNVSGGPLIAAQACFDVRHYALTMQVDRKGRRIDGSVVLRAVVTARSDSLALDLDDELAVTAVHWGDGPVPFRHEDGRIWITPPAPLVPAQEIALLTDLQAAGLPPGSPPRLTAS